MKLQLQIYYFKSSTGSYLNTYSNKRLVNYSLAASETISFDR